jgi:hypothetical protein
VGAVYLITNEGHLNLAKQFLAFNRDGKIAPGARIAGMARVIHERKNWKEDNEAGMADPESTDESLKRQKRT